jgi:hypothetical protein
MTKFENLRGYAKHGKDGEMGDVFEIALKEFFGLELVVSPKKVVDLPVKVSAKVKTFNKVECKTGAGEIRNELKGNSYVIYCPVVDMGTDLIHQEAFLIQRAVFIECVKRAKCFRQSKTATNGTSGEAIQTIWNNKENRPHGRKLFALLDELYEHGIPLAEWLEEVGE